MELANVCTIGLPWRKPDWRCDPGQDCSEGTCSGDSSRGSHRAAFACTQQSAEVRRAVGERRHTAVHLGEGIGRVGPKADSSSALSWVFLLGHLSRSNERIRILVLADKPAGVDTVEGIVVHSLVVGEGLHRVVQVLRRADLGEVVVAFHSLAADHIVPVVGKEAVHRVVVHRAEAKQAEG